MLTGNVSVRCLHTLTDSLPHQCDWCRLISMPQTPQDKFIAVQKVQLSLHLLDLSTPKCPQSQVICIDYARMLIPRRRRTLISLHLEKESVCTRMPIRAKNLCKKKCECTNSFSMRLNMIVFAPRQLGISGYALLSYNMKEHKPGVQKFLTTSCGMERGSFLISSP